MRPCTGLVGAQPISSTNRGRWPGGETLGAHLAIAA
jgi:hypothetical protein